MHGHMGVKVPTHVQPFSDWTWQKCYGQESGISSILGVSRRCWFVSASCCCCCGGGCCCGCGCGCCCCSCCCPCCCCCCMGAGPSGGDAIQCIGNLKIPRHNLSRFGSNLQSVERRCRVSWREGIGGSKKKHHHYTSCITNPVPVAWCAASKQGQLLVPPMIEQMSYHIIVFTQPTERLDTNLSCFIDVMSMEATTCSNLRLSIAPPSP